MHLMRSGDGGRGGTVPQALGGWSTEIDGQEVSSWLWLLLPAQHLHQAIGMSLPGTVNPIPDHATTGEKVRRTGKKHENKNEDLVWKRNSVSHICVGPVSAGLHLRKQVFWMELKEDSHYAVNKVEDDLTPGVNVWLDWTVDI